LVIEKEAIDIVVVYSWQLHVNDNEKKYIVLAGFHTKGKRGRLVEIYL